MKPLFIFVAGVAVGYKLCEQGYKVKVETPSEATTA